MDINWEHVLLGILVTLPSIIAAFSSLKNGKALKNGFGIDPIRQSVLCPKCYHVFVHPEVAQARRLGK